MAGTLAEYTEGVNIAPPEEYCCQKIYILKGGSFASFPEYLAIRSREVLCDCHDMTTIPYSCVGIRCVLDK
ncbi:MAG: hypothetical protein J6S69_08485 [Proteobacteria bacterium]|nr:hypothetical protein [Pseudomonadota bacterium]